MVIKTGILLKSCSQTTMITDTFVRKHRLSLHRANSRIRGVGSNSFEMSKAVKLIIFSSVSNFKLNTEADVVSASSLSYSVKVSLPVQTISKLKNIGLPET